MIVKCSVGKGEMEHTACLSCALAQENTCGYDYAILSAMLASDEHEIRKNEIHTTDITGCPRKAWYDKTDPTPEFIHDMLIRWIGTEFHKLAENDDNNFESELAIGADGVVGRMDIYYPDGRVVDIKTTRWMYPTKLPYGSHALQVNIYAWMLRKMGKPVNRLQIQYVDMSGPTKCRKCKKSYQMIDGGLCCPSCFQTSANAHSGAMLVEIPLMTDEEVENIIIQRKENLETALAMGLPPEKEPGYLCNYCAHYDKCQPEID